MSLAVLETVSDPARPGSCSPRLTTIRGQRCTCTTRGKKEIREGGTGTVLDSATTSQFGGAQWGQA